MALNIQHPLLAPSNGSKRCMKNKFPAFERIEDIDLGFELLQLK